MKQNSMEKRFDEKFVDTQSQPKLSDWTITTNHARYVWDIKAFIKQEMGRVIGEDEVEFKVNGKQKLEYKASDSYYNPVRNQLKAEQRREVGIK